MAIGKKIIMEDPPILPGQDVPFKIQAVSQGEDCTHLISIGDSVPKKMAEKLKSIHSM